MSIEIGSQIPDCKVHVMSENGPSEVSTSELCSGKKVVLFAVPGAFTPGCSMTHLPGYVDNADEIKSKGVDSIICMAVNDAFVMDAWGKAHNAQNKVLMVSDPNCDFTKSIGAETNLAHKGLGIRSKRYVMLVEKGKIIKISEEEIAGKCEATAAENFLKDI